MTVMMIMAILLVVMVMVVGMMVVVSGAFDETNIRDIAEADPRSGFSVAANILVDYRFEFLGSPVGWELTYGGETESFHELQVII